MTYHLGSRSGWAALQIACLLMLGLGCGRATFRSIPQASPANLPGGPAFGPGELDKETPILDEPVEASEPLLLGSGPNVRLTQIASLFEAETSIAVHPMNPLNLIAGAICAERNCFYGSFDGGETWAQGFIQAPWGFQSDPALAFCSNGNAVYGMVSLEQLAPNSYRSAILVSRSTNGGASWPAISTVVDRTSPLANISDKPWITCDATGSAFDNRVYVAYTDPEGACTTPPGCRAVKIHRSTDSGATWSPYVIVSDPPQTFQNQTVLAVGSGGELYVAWNWSDGTPNAGEIRFDKSTNGGVSFGADVIASPFTAITQDPNFRRLTYPAMDVDRSSGTHSGNLYIVFADARFGDADIVLIRSTNGGTTWTSPVRVNDDSLGNNADQWAPWVAVDPKGRVIVSFYDRRRYIGGTQYEVWGAISRDGGQVFDTNFLIGDRPSNAPSPTFVGDYDGLAATADRFWPTWCDLRDSVAGRDIYTDPYPNIFDYDEVTGVVWLDDNNMSFDTQDARFGVDLDYDVVGGLLSELRADMNFDAATCFAPLWPAPPLVDTGMPPVGDGRYYLVRAHGPAGVGTYGDAYPPARPNVRDPLDETLATCP